MALLYSEKVLNFKDIQIMGVMPKGADEEEEPPMVEDYYRVMANFLLYIAQKDDKLTPNGLNQFF